MQRTSMRFFKYWTQLCVAAVTLCLFVHSTSLNAVTVTALGDGAWENGATWSTGSSPTCNDYVIIPAGVVITITSQLDYTTCGGPMVIDVYGTLTFQNGKKISLACGSQVNVQAGGTITSGGGGGASNQIQICNTTAWSSSDGTVTGPASITQAGVGTFPIELISFTANVYRGNSVKLDWSSATETNNKFYTIERSADGVRFDALTTIDSKASKGNSLSRLDYTYTDRKTLAGTSYYRLKQTDYNGKSETFYTVSANIVADKNILFTVFPNPTAGEFTVNFAGLENNHEVQVSLFNIEGKVVYAQNFFLQDNSGSFNVIPTGPISKGMYQCEIVMEGISYKIKVMVN